MRKQLKWTLLTASIALTIALLLSGIIFTLIVLTYDEPVTSVDELRLASFDQDLKGFVLEITLGIDNPNPFKLEVIRITGEIHIDEALVGTLYNSTGSSIDPHGSSELVITVHISDQQMRLYSGKELIVSGRTHGKYLFFEKDAPFEETKALSPNNGGPGNLPPIAFIEGPHTALVLEEVQFTGSGSSDPDGQIISYSWDLGDGSTAEGPDITHRYSRVGVFRVELTVEDDDGARTIAFHELIVGVVP